MKWINYKFLINISKKNFVFLFEFVIIFLGDDNGKNIISRG